MSILGHILKLFFQVLYSLTKTLEIIGFSVNRNTTNQSHI